MSCFCLKTTKANLITYKYGDFSNNFLLAKTSRILEANHNTMNVLLEMKKKLSSLEFHPEICKFPSQVIYKLHVKSNYYITGTEYFNLNYPIKIK